jgi:hypothetical protein
LTFKIFMYIFEMFFYVGVGVGGLGAAGGSEGAAVNTAARSNH